MKECPYRDPHYVSAFFDGVLEKSVETEFARHLLTCRVCADALLNLERDLFLMERMEFARHPRKLLHERAFFRIAGKGLEIVKRLGDGGGFSPFVLAPVRGAAKGEVGYRFERGGVRVEVRRTAQDRVCLDVSGTSGKSLFLYREGRLVEGRANIVDEQLSIDNLPRGNYFLFIKECGSIELSLE